MVARILQQMNIDVQNLAAEVDKALGSIARTYPSNYGSDLQIYITMRVKRLFEVAAEEADRLNDNYISTEHLFLAVLAERTGPSARLLDDFKVDKIEVYAALRALRETTSDQTSNTGSTRWSSSPSVDRGEATMQLTEFLARIQSMKQEIAALREDVHRLHDVPAGITMLKQQISGLREQMQSLEGKIDRLLELAKGEHNDQP